MYKYVKDVLEFKLQNTNVSENMIKMLIIASTSKGHYKDSMEKCTLSGTWGRQKKHTLWHGIMCLKCECCVCTRVPLWPCSTQYQKKYGEFVRVQLVIIIYYSTS